MSGFLSNGVDISTPPGSVIAYTGTSSPSGWLICDGRQVSRTTYSKLFQVIGTNYGGGDGGSTFNIPNYQGKFLVGGYSTSSINASGGSNSFNLHPNTFEFYYQSYAEGDKDPAIISLSNITNDSDNNISTVPANYSINWIIKF